MSAKLARPLALCAVLTIPALFLRLSGVHVAAPLSLVTFGAAVVAASFLLAWAAEAARVDISGPLAIAILAVIAVLPEYAVDLYFSYTAGHNPDYVQYAAANMTGSNRLLLGLGWPLVVIIALWMASRRSGRGVRELVLQSGYRTELARTHYNLGILEKDTSRLPEAVADEIHRSLGVRESGSLGVQDKRQSVQTPRLDS